MLRHIGAMVISVLFAAIGQSGWTVIGLVGMVTAVLGTAALDATEGSNQL